MQQQEEYPVRFTVDYPDRPLDRLTTGFRIFVAIPILIVLGTVSGGGSWESSYDNTRTTTIAAGELLFFGPLLMILFRQKYPRWWFDWNLELQRFGNRVGAYLALMDDRYPATDEEQSVISTLPLPRRPARPEPVVAAGEVAAGHSPLHRAGLPGHPGVCGGDRGLVHPDLGTTGRYAEDVRLRGGRAPLVQPGRRLRRGAGHRPLPAVPALP